MSWQQTRTFELIYSDCGHGTIKRVHIGICNQVARNNFEAYSKLRFSKALTGGA